MPESLNTLSLQCMQCWSGWLRVLVAPSPLPSQINCVCFHCCSRWKAFIYSTDLKLLRPKTSRSFLRLLFQIAPVENDDSYDELKRDAKTCLSLMSQELLYTEQIPMVLSVLQEVRFPKAYLYSYLSGISRTIHYITWKSILVKHFLNNFMFS